LIDHNNPEEFAYAFLKLVHGGCNVD